MLNETPQALEKHCESLDRIKLSMHDFRPMMAETTVTRGIRKGLEDLRRESAISYIDAPSGVGKTEGVKQFIAGARKQEGSDCSVWDITLTANDMSRKDVLSKMVTAILDGKLYGVRSPYGMAEAIREATAGGGGLLIIDEAQHLGEVDKRISLPIINSLRSFSDAGCFGIALLGNGEIYRKLQDGKFPQLTSRLDPNRLEIAELGKGRKGQIALIEQDVLAVMDAWGMSGNGVTEWCLQAAAKPGALRYMTSTYRRTYKHFDGDVDGDALKYIENLTKGNGR